MLITALAACGGTDEADDAPLNQPRPAEANASLEAAPAVVAPEGNVAVPEGDRATVIPAALQGRWALVPGDCTTNWGDAKGLLTVTDSELRFYESHGKVGKVIERAPNRITADFDFQGEGEEWQRRMMLEADGKELVRSESGEGAAAEPFRYRRCPA
jgi:hypothetical protein